MESSVLLFCIGAIAGAILIWGLIWPLSRYVAYLLSPSRAWLFWLITVVLSVPLLAVMGYAVYFIIQGYYSIPGSNPYKFYVFVTSSHMSQLTLGLFMGPILFYWLHFYSRPEPTSIQTSNHNKLTIVICAVTVFSVILPYMHRWLANASSLEISQIGKITIDNKQDAQSQSISFIKTNFGAFSSAKYKGADMLYAIERIVDMSDTTKDGTNSLGMVSRDEKYSKLVRDENQIEEVDEIDVASLDDHVSTSKVLLESQLQIDREFVNTIKPVAECLKSYATEFKDYRLLLVDVKPLIVILTAITKMQEDLDKKVIFRDVHRDLSEEIKKLTENVLKKLTYRQKQQEQRHDDIEGAKEPCKGVSPPSEYAIKKTNFPYKTIALAYLLDAIGAADTAVVELQEWINENAEKVPSWYVQRAQIELTILFEKAVPGGHKNSMFRNYMESHISKFENIIQHTDTKSWSSNIDECKRKSIFEAQLVFTYMTQVNIYVKSSSNLDSINSEIVRMAETNKNTNLDCFDRLNYVYQEKNGWRAEFLTTFAYAQIVLSYDERLYSRTGHSEQQRVRDIAKKDLYDSINLLSKVQENAKNEKKREGSQSLKSASEMIFAQLPWDDTLAVARSAMRIVGD